MLKKRIIPVQLLRDGRLVKTVRFDAFRDVGDPVQSSKVYNSQYADELIFLNIARERRSVDTLLGLIEKVSEVCFMPLAFGGGIGKSEEAEALIRNGADKVVLNSVCYRDPAIVSCVAEKFGSQAVVVSVDVKKDASSGDYALYSDCGRKREAVSLSAHIEAMVDRGAGEIFLNSIDQDGTMAGYDLTMLKSAQAVSRVPLIGAGGAGNYEHLKQAFKESGISALACGSLFNFGDNNPMRAKAFLSNHGLPFKKV